MNTSDYRSGAASLFAVAAREPRHEPVADHVCCPFCLSEDVRWLGNVTVFGNVVTKAFKCNVCGDTFMRTVSDETETG